MKRFYLFLTLALVLFSFNVDAQNGRFLHYNACNAAYDVDLSIEQVVWNADVYDWAEIVGATIGLNNTVIGAPANLPESFHAIVLDIPYDINWNIAASYRFNISINQFGGSVKPVMVFFPDEGGGIVGGIEPIIDAQGFLTGFEITKPVDHGGGGGVATTAVVMGRVSSQSGTGCMKVRTTNARGTSVGGLSCNNPNDSDMQCGSGVQGRLAQNPDTSINIYPNPVQDNLFVETAGLDIQDVNFLNMNGQNINAKVSIRNGVDRLQINTAQLQSGIYLLRLKTSDEIIIEKIIVQ